MLNAAATRWQLAQINIARIKGINMNDPVMKEFADNLDIVNELAESSEGFIWRLKGNGNNATDLDPYDDERVIVNMSVWESVETLEHYVYKTFHTDFLRRRKEWFHTFGKVYTCMWWVPAGHYPTVQEAVAKLEYLQLNGPSQQVFDFKKRYPTPL